jgi:hypothetical protein
MSEIFFKSREKIVRSSSFVFQKDGSIIYVFLFGCVFFIWFSVYVMQFAKDKNHEKALSLLLKPPEPYRVGSRIARPCRVMEQGKMQ